MMIYSMALRQIHASGVANNLQTMRKLLKIKEYLIMTKVPLEVCFLFQGFMASSISKVIHLDAIARCLRGTAVSHDFHQAESSAPLPLTSKFIGLVSLS